MGLTGGIAGASPVGSINWYGVKSDIEKITKRLTREICNAINNARLPNHLVIKLNYEY